MSPIIGVLAWVSIGMLVGWLVGKFVHADGPLALSNLGVGVFGAVAAGTIARAMFSGNPSNDGDAASLFAAFGGACVLLAVSKLVARAV